MKHITVLGVGPAAVVAALLLHKMNFAVQVLGLPRRTPLLEGASARVAQGLERAGCHYALEVLGSEWKRTSAWGGAYQAANGEHVIERSLFDSALIDDLEEAGIDFHDVSILGTERVGDKIRIDARLSNQKKLTFFADYIVDARGRSTPKIAPNVLAGPVSVALTRNYHRAVPGTRRTLTESFEQGWAWSTLDVDGRCSIQFVVDPGSIPRGVDLNALHDDLYRQLNIIPRELGQPMPCGYSTVRGSQAVLRGGLVNEFSIRVGDAAYSNDPLSGHGMYEAIGGAYAAAPVINTILNDPARKTLAMGYYQQRAALTFAQRSRAGALFYQSETRWANADFWATRCAWDAWKSILEDERHEGLLKSAPVVVNGFIRARTVVVTDQHPQGVRFLAGIDLAQLIACLCDGAALESLPARVKGDTQQIAAAVSWLSCLPELSAPTVMAFIERLRNVVNASNLQS